MGAILFSFLLFSFFFFGGCHVAAYVEIRWSMNYIIARGALLPGNMGQL